MANAFINEALLQQEIDQQVGAAKKLSFHEKKLLKKSIQRQSVLNAPKNTSMQTMMSISNTMVGSSLLLFPVLFRDSGVVSALLVALIFCGMSCKTCQLLVIHNKPDELDLTQTIHRILGFNFNRLFNVTNILLLYFAGVVYFILICNMAYPLIQLLFNTINVSTANKNEFTFQMVSYQWCGIVYMMMLFCIMLMKDVKIIIKLVQYGSISVISYILFIITRGTINIQQISDINIFTLDVITLCGVFSLAFMVHQCIIPIIKSNLIQDNNIRDIGISFGGTYLIYAIVGVFGAFSITNVECRTGTDGSTVLDYFEQDIFTYVIIALQLFQLTTVFPMLQFIIRSQFFAIVSPLSTPSTKYQLLYTLIVAISTTLFQSFNIDVSLILSLSGAVVGFFQLYLIPIALHLVCLYSNPKTNLLHLNSTFSSEYLENADMSIMADEVNCNNHTDRKNALPKFIRYSIYSMILLFGMSVAILKLATIEI